jgi:hypothetical protein
VTPQLGLTVTDNDPRVVSYAHNIFLIIQATGGENTLAYFIPQALTENKKFYNI